MFNKEGFEDAETAQAAMIHFSSRISRVAFSTHAMSEEARMRIGRALRNIPDDYRHFFVRPGPEVIDLSPYHRQTFSLVLHLEQLLTRETAAMPLIKRTFVIAGRERLGQFLWRMRLALRWGHFFWRLSDLRCLHLEPVKIVCPVLLGETGGPVEMKVYWQLCVRRTDASVVFLDGDDYSPQALFSVQWTRLRRLLSPADAHLTNNPPTVLYSGLARYVFDRESGYCQELHVERIEPRLDQSRWRAAWVSRLAVRPDDPQPVLR